ncbi:MAG: hypothetical protein AAGI69_09850 [Cyanobacteria bacterium P01_H01_bin.21]
MGLETTVLLGILTLLPFCLGKDAVILLLIKPALSKVGDQPALEVMNSLQTMQSIAVVYILIFVGAVVLNVTSHSRSEPYLLKIGLVSLIIYFLFTLVGFISTDSQIISLFARTNLDLNSPLNGTLLWIQLLTILVCYWSFLHYAMNPKL